jgi:hypothetical protein
VRIKTAFTIGIALLLCSLAIMELPELIRLVDDTSNDYSLTLSAKDAPAVIKVRVRVLAEASSDSVRSRYPSGAVSFRRHVAISGMMCASKETFRMLCIQRT